MTICFALKKNTKICLKIKNSLETYFVLSIFCFLIPKGFKLSYLKIYQDFILFFILIIYVDFSFLALFKIFSYFRLLLYHKTYGNRMDGIAIITNNTQSTYKIRIFERSWFMCDTFCVK